MLTGFTIAEAIENAVNASVNNNSNGFELKLNVYKFTYNASEGPASTYTFILVDDEFIIRSAMKRVISAHFKSSSNHVNLMIIEASDGIECLLANYLAKNLNIKIDAVISDENMPFISGGFSSKIIGDLISLGVLPDTKMFISSALCHTKVGETYSKIVRKIYSKPIDKNNARDIIQIIDMSNKNNR